MSILPISGSVAAATGAQARAAETDRVGLEDVAKARETAADRSAESAAGIGETKDHEPTQDRDADGRRVLEFGDRKKRQEPAPETPPAIAPRAKDPSGAAGGQLDLDG